MLHSPLRIRSWLRRRRGDRRGRRPRRGYPRLLPSIAPGRRRRCCRVGARFDWCRLLLIWLVAVRPAAGGGISSSTWHVLRSLRWRSAQASLPIIIITSLLRLPLPLLQTAEEGIPVRTRGAARGAGRRRVTVVLLLVIDHGLESLAENNE